MTQETTSECAPPEPLAGSREGWALDPDITFLNHGSFGARRERVLQRQALWRAEFERSPVAFLDRDRDRLLGEARAKLARFLDVPDTGLAFVTNATDGVNAVVRSLRFAPGDRILTTTHAYGAVRQTLRLVAERAGAEVVEVDIPVPCPSDAVVQERIIGALSSGARLLVVDHVTSPTALRFRVGAIVSAAREYGVPVLVDGAHAPGMLADPINEADADYYTGNLHKWINAPSGAAFLFVRDPHAAPPIHPTVISHFFGDGFDREFSWQGTRDVSQWLTVPEAIAEGEEWPGGWKGIRAHNDALARWVRRRLTSALDVPAAGPDAMLGSMVSVALPARLTERFAEPEEIIRALYERFRIEVPVFGLAEKWWIRASCQIYNRPHQYDALVEALKTLAR